MYTVTSIKIFGYINCQAITRRWKVWYI